MSVVGLGDTFLYAIDGGEWVTTVLFAGHCLDSVVAFSPAKTPSAITSANKTTTNLKFLMISPFKRNAINKK